MSAALLDTRVGCDPGCVCSYRRSWAFLSLPAPLVPCAGGGLRHPSGCVSQNWGVLDSFLSLPMTYSLVPGPRDSSFLSQPVTVTRALVWPPSSSPDSVHSLFPVSLPPRHSLPHVARGIFLKPHIWLLPSLHKSFRDALWPAG